jgi:phosphatidylglycerophosphate synthase
MHRSGVSAEELNLIFKCAFMNARDRLQQIIYKLIDPFVRVLIRLGLTPNGVTTIGLILNIGVAIIFIAGAEKSNRGDLSYVGWAGGLILFAGLFDMLDGQVARLGNMASAFGAMYDSVLDRYSEMIMFFGICYYLVGHHYFLSSIFAFIALIGSMMVSYTRARAEGLGVGLKGGLMQRPERVVTVGITAMACGISAAFIGGNYKLYVPGIPFHIFETMSIFTIPISIMAVLTNVTAVRRLYDAKKALDEKEKSDKKRTPAAAKSAVLLLAIVVGGAAVMHGQGHTAVVTTKSTMDTFPVPPGGNNQLFYLQRTSNKNTIVYDLNMVNGLPDKEDPVHVYWIRYSDKGQKQELSYVQRNFAYGIKSTALANNAGYALHFVSYKKYVLYLMKSAADNKYRVFTTVNSKTVVLNRIFIKINGGSFWTPKVEYVEIKGVDPISGREITDRLKI